MQIAIDVAGFAAGRGRRAAPGDGLQALHREDGAAARAALRRAWPPTASPATLADEIFDKLLAFANFGFPESHAISFAYLVYASAWFKRYHPAAFCAALLNAQPMGFYSPQSLVADARRHGVRGARPGHQPRRGPQADRCSRDGRTAPARPGASGWGWPRSARSATTLAERIEAERDARRPVPGPGRPGPARPAHRPRRPRRWPPRARSARFGVDRREALWAAGAVAAERPGPAAGHGRRRSTRPRCRGWPRSS